MGHNIRFYRELWSDDPLGRRHGRGALPCFVCTPAPCPSSTGPAPAAAARGKRLSSLVGQWLGRPAAGFSPRAVEKITRTSRARLQAVEQAVAHEQRAGCRRLAGAPARCQRERRRGTGHTGARGLSCRDRSSIVLWLCARLLWLARPRGNEGKATSYASFVTARAGLVGCATV